MKQLILIVSLALSINVYAQDDKTVTLVVSGQGKTQDEAKQNALRNAIEQAFGTFISSKTEILNDNLVKDEIVSVSNGNIQKFEVISEVQIPNIGYATSLKATVSVTKLTSFSESKGVSIEFKGSLFAFNVNQQILNEKNEIKAIEDLCKVVTKLSDTSFEYSIKASDPVAVNGSNEKWRIPMYISVSANANLLSLANYINQTLKGLSLSIDEAINYTKLGKLVYPISFAANEDENTYIILRTKKGVINFISQMYYFNHSIQNFKISNGLSAWKISDFPRNIRYIYDYGFRILCGNNLHSSISVFFGSREIFKRGCEEMGKSLELEERLIDYCYFQEPWDYFLDYSEKKREIEKGSYELNTIYKVDHFGQFDNERTFYDFRRTLGQFYFPKKFKNMINSDPGVIISFIGITPQKEIVRFYYEDIKSLDEINKTSEYKVSPIVD
jgi:hypothetical protein